MDVKQAIRRAKDYVEDVYADEDIFNLGLEEARFSESENSWIITVGFSRPWNKPQDDPPEPLFLGRTPETLARRSYKAVWIDADAGTVTSLADRFMTDHVERATW